jgi:hypothetical protein
MADDPNELVRFWWPRDEWEATAICAALEEQGIPNHFAGQSRVGSSAFNCAGIATRQIYVRRCDFDRARKFIEDHDWPTYTPGDAR